MKGWCTFVVHLVYNYHSSVGNLGCLLFLDTWMDFTWVCCALPSLYTGGKSRMSTMLDTWMNFTWVCGVLPSFYFRFFIFFLF
jgi:hypothetical protein